MGIGCGLDNTTQTLVRQLMKLSRSNSLLVALSAAMSVFGFWGFAITVPPIPEPMLTTTGTISAAEAHFRKGSISIIRFSVAPDGKEFAYPDILRNAQTVWDKIDRGLPVEVSYTNSQEPELWGLRVSDETLLTPDQAYAARRENGYWGLGIGVAFLFSCLYMVFIEGRRDAA